MMKLTLLILSLILCISANATSHYVAASGNDSNDGSQGSPWKTISKVNSATLANDVVFFNRGDVFFGTVQPGANGITYDAYGSGAMPVITATKQLTFTASGGNIYTSNSFLPQSTPKLLTIGGVVQQIGRWPNASNSFPYGYLDNENLVFNKASDWTELTDNDWGSLTKPTTDFSGAQIAWRVNKYRFATYTITQRNSGNTAIFHIPNYDNSGEVGRGYFIQNHIKCLDLNTEWCWNDAANTASIYLTAGPGSLDIEMPYLDNCLNTNGKSNLTIQNLYFTGANNNGINVSGGSNVVIQNNTIKNCGSIGINIGGGASSVTIQNNNVDNAFQFGIHSAKLDGQVTISHNTVQHIFKILGMGTGGNVNGSGIDVYGSNKTITYNYIHDVAYAGVNFFQGGNILVYRNVIDGYCNRLHDGGGTYTFGDEQFGFTNKVVKQNIAINPGLENPTIGTFEQTNAYTIYTFYSDKWANHITYDGNVAIGGYTGLYSNDPSNITWVNNFLYNLSGRNIEIRRNETKYLVQGNTLNNNVVFSTNNNGKAMWTEQKVQNDIKVWGNFNNNYYVRPYNGGNPFTYYINGNSSSYTLPQWHSTYNFEASGHLAPRTLTSSQNPAGYTRLRVNMSDTVQIYDMGNTEWYTSRGAVLPIGTKLVLQPYTAEGLIYKSGDVKADDIGTIGGDGTGGSGGGDTGGNGGGPPPPPPPPENTIRIKGKFKVIHINLP